MVVEQGRNQQILTQKAKSLPETKGATRRAKSSACGGLSKKNRHAELDSASTLYVAYRFR